MIEFSSKNSLGNQGWWAVLTYLIRIGDWPAAIGMLSLARYREYQAAYRKAQAE